MLAFIYPDLVHWPRPLVYILAKRYSGPEMWNKHFSKTVLCSRNFTRIFPNCILVQNFGLHSPDRVLASFAYIITNCTFVQKCGLHSPDLVLWSRTLDYICFNLYFDPELWPTFSKTVLWSRTLAYIPVQLYFDPELWHTFHKSCTFDPELWSTFALISTLVQNIGQYFLKNCSW